MRGKSSGIGSWGWLYEILIEKQTETDDQYSKFPNFGPQKKQVLASSKHAVKLCEVHPFGEGKSNGKP